MTEKNIHSIYLANKEISHLHILYLPPTFIFSAESCQHKETRIIDLHINV